MRLLILDQFSDLGGGQQCLLELLPAIRERGWEALVGLPGSGPLVQRVRESGYDTVELQCGPFSYGRKTLADTARFLAQTPRLARQIRALAERFGADLIYVNGPRLLPAVVASERPVVHHAHRILPSRAVRELCGFAVRHCGARVIAVCRYVAEPWVQFAGAERVTVIYNGVEGPRELAPRGREGSPKIGSLGRIAPEKGQLDFVSAARRIDREWPGCRFVIYGAALIAEPVYEHEVRDAARGLPVEFAGWHGDVQAVLADMDVLLVPSGAHEATTRVIPEAFAAGTPVIAFPSGGIPEVIEHGRTGFLASDAAQMARLALDLLRDRSRWSAIAEAARESWNSRFTLERWRNEVLDHISTPNMAAASRTNMPAPARTAP
jgi:glycosyltransferase involved in cell wall biosynthesis